MDEGDFATAQRDLRARKQPNYDGACFQAQQSGEKYLKAWLVERGVEFPKLHSLTALLHMILPLELSWTDLKAEAAQLTIYAIEFRYPGKSADKELAKEAIGPCRRIRDRVRASLGLAAAPAPKVRRERR